MSKIFTDEQVAKFKADGHPVAQLMEQINEHTNSRAYAAVNLRLLAELAEENYIEQQRDRIKLKKKLRTSRIAKERLT